MAVKVIEVCHVNISDFNLSIWTVTRGDFLSSKSWLVKAEIRRYMINLFTNSFFFHGSTAPSGTGPPHCRRLVIPSS